MYPHASIGVVQALGEGESRLSAKGITKELQPSSEIVFIRCVSGSHRDIVEKASVDGIRTNEGKNEERQWE